MLRIPVQNVRAWLASWSPRRRKPRPFRRRLEVEMLEDRINPAPNPVINITAPATPFLGTTAVPLSITFQNTGTAPGYAPWDYAVLPNVSALPDKDPGEGLSFDSGVTPTFLGVPVTFQEINVPGSGQVTGPSFALGTNGNPIVLTGLTANDQVVFFQLPFGSFAANQPGATINFAGTLSNEATAGMPLTLTAGGGFSYGADPLNDPSTDPPIVAGTTTATTTPSLFTVTKTYAKTKLGLESETATGPNFPEQFQINVSVAPGQTLTNFSITDFLPSTEQWLGAGTVTASANGGTFTGLDPVLTTATTAKPGGNIVADFTQVVGTGNPTDATMTYSFYVPENDATGNPVLNLSTGAFQDLTNTATAAGTYISSDTSDNPSGKVSNSSNPATATITAKSIAVQKIVGVVGGGPAAQGSVLQYTINFQVSDYFAFNQLNIGDLLPDGVRFYDPSSSFDPTLSVTQHTDVTDNTGSSAAAPFHSANYLAPTTTTFNTDGTQTLNFAVSNELIARGQSGDLIGADIPPGGTGGPAPTDAVPPPSGGTTGQIVFYAQVQTAYSVKTSPNGNQNVKQGDSFTNVVPNSTGPDVSIQPGGQVLNYANLAGTGTFQADDATGFTRTVSVATGQFSKTIYAINGNTSITAPYQVQTGDVVTYRLDYLLPTSTAENLTLTDYLPLPVFNAATVTTFDPGAGTSTPPLVGHAEFGPGNGSTTSYTTVFPGSSNDPTISTNPGSNSVTFTFPKDLEDPSQRQSLVDVLFSVQVLDQPFGDGLSLTNQANSVENNTDGTVTPGNAIQQIVLTQPDLNVTKGIVSTNDTGGVFAPTTVGPVPFTAPGVSGAAFTGTINSPGLAANPVNSNLSNLHAGDLVKFAVVVQNTGQGADGAFNVEFKDTLPAGFVIPTNATGLNLQVVNGAGTALPFTNVNAGDTNPLFQNGIELTDPSATQGALAAGKDTSGKLVTTGANIAVVTYDLQVEPNNTAADAVHPGEKLTNTATLFNYSAVPGGVDYLSTPLTDPATATITLPGNTKSLVATSEPTTSGSNVAIGEIVRYQLVVQLPASASPGFQIVDQLPTGLSYLGNTTVAFESQNGPSELASSTLTNGSFYVTGVTSSGSLVTPTALLPAADITGGSGDGSAVTFSLGNVTNNDTTDTTNATGEFVVLDFNALVDNVSHNVKGVTDNNNFIDKINTGGGPAQVGNASNNVGVTIVEPHITTVKTIAPTTGENGTSIVYTITYTSDGGNDAFLDDLTDPSFPSATINATSLTVTSSGVVGLVNSSTLVAGVPTVNITASDMPKGSSVTVTIDGTVQNAVVGQTVVNTADATWSSLPGGVGTPTGANNTTGQVTPGPNGAANGARDGAGGVNSYASSGTATLNIVAPLNTKSLVATSEPSTSGSNVAIGEIARYSLVVQMPEAVSNKFQIVDNLPAGLSFLGNTKIAFVSPNGAELSSSDSTINSLAGLNVTGTTGNVTPSAVFPTDASHISGGTGDGSAVTFNLGTITNSDTSQTGTGGDEFIVIQFNALVDNVASNTVGVTDNNNFITEVNNGSGAVQVGNKPTVGVTIVEPKISTAKSVTNTTAGPNFGTTVVENGNTVTYTITYTNAGNNDAFIPALTDTVPASITVSSIVVATTGTVTNLVNSSSGNTIDVTADDMAVGSTVTVTVQGTVVGAVVNTNIPNTANATWSSLPGGTGTTSNPTGQNTPGTDGAANGARDGDTTASGGAANTYASSSTATLVIQNPIPAKSLIVTSEPSTTDPNVAIGEIARFQLTVQMPEAVSNNFQIVDNLPVGLSYLGNAQVAFVSPGNNLSTNDATLNALVSPNVVGTNGNVTPSALLPAGNITSTGLDGAPVTFSLGNVTNNDTSNTGTGGDEFIVIQFNALVDNVAHNVVGVTDTNTFIVQANNAAAPPVADPGFEVPNVGSGTFNSFQYNPSGSPWTFSASSGVSGNGSGFTSGNPSAPQGTQVGFMQGTGSISQSVTLAAGTYTISFQAAQRQNTQASFQTFNVLVDGNIVGTIDPAGTSYALYSTNSFTVTAGSHTIQFVGLNPNGGDNTAFIDAVNITPAASVTIVEPKITDTTKTVTSAGRDSGEPVSYAVTYSNSGNADAFDARIVDALPSTLTLNTGSIVVKRNGAAIATGFTNNTSGNTVDVTLADVAPGDSIEIDYTATINAADPAGTVIPNTANLTYTSLPGGVGTPTGPSNTTGQVTPGPEGAANGARDYSGSGSQSITVSSVNVSVTKVDDKGGSSITPSTGAVVPGTSFTYTIAVSNSGPDTATSVAVSDPLPSGITSFVWSGNGQSNVSGPINDTIANLAPSATVTYTVTATVDPSATGTLSNTATVSAVDNTSSNTSATDTDTLTPQAALTITKTDPIGQYTPGGPITYTITVTNTGPSDVTGATIADIMPAAITSDSWSAVYSAGSGLLASPSSGTGNIDILNTDLLVGGTATITLIAQVSSTATGSLVNTASVTFNGSTASATDTDSPTGSLSGTVFADNNNDGIFNGADFGIANAGLTLEDSTGTAIATTTTDSSGQYNFTGLLVGTYAIVENVETQPTQYVDGKDTIGTLGGDATVKDVDWRIVVNAGDHGTGYNFAEIPPADPQGFVFQDLNDNGVKDAGEPGIAGVTITLTGTDVQGNPVNISTTTNAAGFYQFQTRDAAGDLLLPGTYAIAETRPPGFLDGKLQNGTPPAASIVNRTFQNIDLTLQPFFGGDYNFGELLPGSLAGSVYVDPNSNGIRDPGEMGVPGATVTLTGTDDQGNAVSVPVVTDANGNYVFEDMRPGTYQLTITQPAAYTPGATTAGSLGGVAGSGTIGAITVGVGQNGVNYLFGERGLNSTLVSKQFFLSTSPPITATPGSGVAIVDPPADQPQPAADQVFVSNVYLELLGRAADSGGLQYWAGLLNAGASPVSVVLNIENSNEYRTNEVTALYQHYLHRALDPGAAVWVNLLANGASIEQVTADILGSPEYFALHGSTNQGFLDAVYQDVLNRSADTAGESSWLQALANGVSRQAVAAGFLTSTEYRADMVEAYYSNYLGRVADSGGLASWVGALQTGLTDQQVLASIFASAEGFRKWS